MQSRQTGVSEFAQEERRLRELWTMLSLTTDVATDGDWRESLRTDCILDGEAHDSTRIQNDPPCCSTPRVLSEFQIPEILPANACSSLM